MYLDGEREVEIWNPFVTIWSSLGGSHKCKLNRNSMWPPILWEVRLCIHVSLHGSVYSLGYMWRVWDRWTVEYFLYGHEAKEIGQSGAVPLGSCLLGSLIVTATTQRLSLQIPPFMDWAIVFCKGLEGIFSPVYWGIVDIYHYINLMCTAWWFDLCLLWNDSHSRFTNIHLSNIATTKRKRKKNFFLNWELLGYILLINLLCIIQQCKLESCTYVHYILSIYLSYNWKFLTSDHGFPISLAPPFLSFASGNYESDLFVYEILKFYFYFLRFHI